MNVYEDRNFLVCLIAFTHPRGPAFICKLSETRQALQVSPKRAAVCIGELNDIGIDPSRVGPEATDVRLAEPQPSKA